MASASGSGILRKCLSRIILSGSLASVLPALTCLVPFGYSFLHADASLPRPRLLKRLKCLKVPGRKLNEQSRPHGKRRAYTPLKVEQPVPDSSVIIIWECRSIVTRYSDFPEELDI